MARYERNWWLSCTWNAQGYQLLLDFPRVAHLPMLTSSTDMGCPACHFHGTLHPDGRMAAYGWALAPISWLPYLTQVMVRGRDVMCSPSTGGSPLDVNWRPVYVSMNSEHFIFVSQVIKNQFVSEISPIVIVDHNACA
jgi:hypothetical protein